MYIEYYSFYRQISPSTNLVSEKSLTKKAQFKDMKKLLVNAQVKAMVSFLETFSNILYVIVVLFTVRTSYTTLLQIMSLYLVLLPYASLMNTSHNKNRIVEFGWKNVFRNILERNGDTMSCKEKRSMASDSIRQTGNEGENSLEDKRVTKVFATTTSTKHPDVNFSPKHAWLDKESSTSKGHKAINETPLSPTSLEENL